MTWSSEHGNRVLAEFMPAITFSKPFREMRMEESAPAGRPLSEARLYRWEPDEAPPLPVLWAVERRLATEIEHWSLAITRDGTEPFLVEVAESERPTWGCQSGESHSLNEALFEALSLMAEQLLKRAGAAVEGVEG